MNKNSNSNPIDRFTDQKLTIMDFMDEILVICPGCSNCAHIKPIPGNEVSMFTDRRLTCTSCGMTKEKKTKKVLLNNEGSPLDCYFGLPLWFIKGHGAKTLWAYNKKHLEYIESFVKATHRMRDLDGTECLNNSIVSRLPGWIKKGSNRKQILSLIQKLKGSI